MAETKPKTIILDTDIGPDCDDVGALLMLLKLEKAGLCRIAAITHCTSNPFGCGCIDAICRAEGRSDMPIGTLKRDGILYGLGYTEEEAVAEAGRCLDCKNKPVTTKSSAGCMKTALPTARMRRMRSKCCAGPSQKTRISRW